MSSEFCWIISGDGVVEPGTYCDQQITILHRKVWRPQRDNARAAEGQRVICRNKVGRIPGRNDGYLQRIVETLKVFCSARYANPISSQNERASGSFNQLRHVLCSILKHAPELRRRSGRLKLAK